jgi:type IV pilus assembly protein PilV
MNISDKQCAGFTLMETLVSTLVLSIGLLGVAGLQASSLRNNHSALLRSQATQLAYEYTDIVRSNPTAETANTFSSFDTQNNNVSITTSCQTASGCSSTEMANTDLAKWSTAINSVLTGGSARVTRVSNIYNIAINWTDDRDNNATKTFNTSFRP